MYPKSVIQDCDTYSKVEYDISSEEIEPNYYHHFIYDYDKQTNSVQMVKSEKSLANRKTVAIYDTNGTRLNAPQKGINIVLYSDGSSEKIIEQ